MRVVCTCHDPFPSGAAHTQQIFCTLVEVARRGVDVRLLVPGRQGRLTTVEHLCDWYGLKGKPPSTFSVETIDGVESPRWLSQAAFDLRVARAVRERTPDLVWTRNVGATLWLTRAGLPTIFETYRPDIATDWRFGLWRRQVLTTPSFLGLIHHSSVADLAFARAGVPSAKRLVARNGFAPAWMTPRLDRQTARQMIGISDAHRPLVVYAGDLHPAKGIAALMRLASAVPDARMLAVGADSDGQIRSLEAKAREARAHNLVVRRRVPIGELAPFLYAADVLVIPPPGEPMKRSRTVLPIKVFLYLAAGRPILAPRRPDIEEVLTDGVNARLFDPADDLAAVRALRELVRDDALCDRVARKALEDSGRYTWSERAAKIAEFLIRICT